MVDYASFAGAFKGRKVFITGHTGFKGAWLSLWMHYLGAQVIGYSLAPPSQPNMFESAGLEERVTHIFGDIVDGPSLHEALSHYRPEVVFHLAAQSLVRFSYVDPVLTYQTNVIGTANVLEGVRRISSVRGAVIVTSDKCYENREWVWGYRETEPMGGHDPYSSSKGCAELVTSAYVRSFFPPEEYGKTHGVLVASTRAGNVIGGGDWGVDRLVPDCARFLSRGEEIVIRSPK
ncbi:MAG: CDP-glucose 4,6-dehydratase, partial [Nitrospirae bacterium]|nr:CDP-glucose 4,6-dehydratase [Nitrospirota bacterium]